MFSSELKKKIKDNEYFFDKKGNMHFVEEEKSDDLSHKDLDKKLVSIGNPDNKATIGVPESD